MGRASAYSCTHCGKPRPKKKLTLIADGRALCERCFRNLPWALQVKVERQR
jgi:hypothetical protein